MKRFRLQPPASKGPNLNTIRDLHQHQSIFGQIDINFFRMASEDQMVRVVEDRFCVPYTLELIVKKKLKSFSNAHYDVFDTTGNVLLQVDGGVWKFKRKRVMKDPSGLPVITMREKQPLSWNEQWEIHRGESREEDHLLCTVRQSKALQIKSKFDVYLARSSSSKGNGSDFTVTGSFTSLSFKVRRGNSIIAEVCHNFTWASCKGKESFKVKVYPEVDYAFIVALLVVMHENEGT